MSGRPRAAEERERGRPQLLLAKHCNVWRCVMYLFLLFFSLLQGIAVGWVNSSTGVHTFLTFNAWMNESETLRTAQNFDFVWGSNATSIPWWRAANPAAVLGFYMPFTRDPTQGHNPDPARITKPLSWWQVHHPEVVFYQCDRKTPAYECFGGQPCRPVVPLDLSAPSTLDVQFSLGVEPAAAAGYDAVCLDNFSTQNNWGGCGSFSGPGGAWVGRYNGSHSDPLYESDTLQWLTRFVDRAHALNLSVIPNYGVGQVTPTSTVVSGIVDGVLDEGGWVHWGNATSWQWLDNCASLYAGCPQALMNADVFAQRLAWARLLAQRGKAFFPINEWGPGTDFGMNPTGIPYNISGDSHRWIRQWVVAAQLLSQGAAGGGTYLVCLQCYGAESYYSEEYGARVGTALGEPVLNATTGVWRREFSGATVFVNPASLAGGSDGGPSPQPVELEGSYRDLYGGLFPRGQYLLNATSGWILLKEQ